MIRPRALVVVNPAARHGRAEALWGRVRSEVDSRFEATVVVTDPAGRWKEAIPPALHSGVRVFVAAGGDGTVHALADGLIRLCDGIPLGDIRLAAVGLGSSNDFHKPFGLVRSGVPLRLDSDAARPRDLGRVRWVDADGQPRESVLVVSASAGVVAEGNDLFARSPLGRRHTGWAIVWAALRAIVRHRPFPLHVRQEGREEVIDLSSLSILKTPWLSGAFRYDIPVRPDDGRFGVGICEAMGRGRLLRTLASLAQGRFAGCAGTRCFLTPALEVSSDAPFLLEIDGEVVLPRRAAFDLRPEQVLACA